MSNYASTGRLSAGRGLSALLGNPTQTDEPTQAIAIALIHPFRFQRRRFFDPDTIEQLAESIKEVGVLQPLLVREHPEAPGAYELIAGERRLRSATLAGLTQVPVIIRSLNDLDATEVHLAENLQRDDLNAIDETEGILQFLALKLNNNPSGVVSLLHQMQNHALGKVTNNVISSAHGQMIEQVFERLGMKWSSFVANRLPILNFPEEILESMRSGRLEYTKAKEIAKLKDPDDRAALLTEAVGKDLSLSDIKSRLSELKPTNGFPAAKLFETPTFKAQLDETFRELKKAKVWEDPGKKKRLDKLMAQLRSLLNE